MKHHVIGPATRQPFDRTSHASPPTSPGRIRHFRGVGASFLGSGVGALYQYIIGEVPPALDKVNTLPSLVYGDCKKWVQLKSRIFCHGHFAVHRHCLPWTFSPLQKDCICKCFIVFQFPMKF